MRLWLRSPILAVIFALAIGMVAGCSNHDAPVFSPDKTPGVNFSEAVAPYQLVFLSRTYDSENDETTYLYQLQNTPDFTTGEASVLPVIHLFTSVTVELPACAPAPSSYSSPDGATVYTNPNGVYGIEWGVGYDDNPDYYYSVTFPGDVPQGVVRGMVTTGGFTYIQNLAGPCEGNHQVAGTVFSDGNGNGTQEGNELGIADITVRLSGGEGDQTFKTDSDGNYLFIASTGTYAVVIDSVTADSDFNETLYATWVNTSPTSIEVTVGPDAADKDFGWEPDVAAIIAGIDSGELPTTGKSYKWWRKEFLRVINGNNNTAYTEQELLDFVHEIEALALLSEYDFTPGHELEEVYAILNNHAFGEDGNGSEIMVNAKSIATGGNHDDFAFLLRELLTTELNHVSGRGLSNLQLQAILVNWGETVLNNNAPAPEFSVIGDPGPGPNAVTNPLADAGTIFRKTNGATGGGGTGD